MTPEITDPAVRAIAEEIAADPANASYTKRGVGPLFYAGPQCRIMIVGQAPGRVAEETGIHGRIIRHLASIDYWFSGNDRRVHKVVHHYLMAYESGTISVDGDPDHEAEEAAWVPLRDVSRQLAYPNERRIVRIALDLLYRDGRD